MRMKDVNKIIALARKLTEAQAKTVGFLTV
jgi:hypothetical protein